MPICSQGNIFDAVNENRAELAVIFGHVGYNNMGLLWRDFAQQIGPFAHIKDPFRKLACTPIQSPNGAWLWFVAAQQNNGIVEDDLVSILDNIFEWARNNGIRSVITNGVANIDHGLITNANRQSDDMRALFLIQDANARELADRIKIELTSLNDVFMRNAGEI